jgi:hypothetical protein
MRAVRFLNVGLLLGLGASIATAVERLGSHPAPEKGPEIVTPAPVPPPQPPPPPSGGAWEPGAPRSATVLACYTRVRRKQPYYDGDAVALRLSIGISGRVKHIALITPNPKSLVFLPCIREDVARWVFPPNEGGEYGVDIHLSLPRDARSLLREIETRNARLPTEG